ncbi:MAG: MFS transporter, partial [Gammaproteobacteria bacterium]
MKLGRGDAEIRTAQPLARTVTLLLVGSLTIMAATAVSPSLPAIEARFAGVPQAPLLTRLLVTLPALFIVLCAPFAGGVIDRYGRRRLLIGAVLVYALGGLSGLLLDSLPALLAGRALLGFGVAGIMTTATALAGDYYTGAARDRFMGLQNSAMGFGGLLYLTAGGVLAELHWRAPFAIYGLALLLLPALVAWIAEPPSLRASAAAADAAPRRPQRALIATLFFASVVNSVVFYVGPTQLPFLLQGFGPDAPTRTGLALGMITLFSALASLGYGRLRPRLGLLGGFALGFGLLASG